MADLSRWGWQVAVGDVLKRAEIHARLGGAHGPGISYAPRTSVVMLFASDAGKVHGYKFSGLQEDGSYHYTGEGQFGDQKITRGNRALLREDVVILLFENADSRDHTLMRYLGVCRLDKKSPYSVERSPDSSGAVRDVFVFKLWLEV